MSNAHIALVFDDQVRPDTTGVYCLRALQQLAEVHHVRPAQMATLQGGEFDLYLSIDDGLDYRLPQHLRPSALWAIDTHLNPDRIVRRAREVDLTFAAQRDGVALLRREGVECAGWLPLACDPSVHRRHDVPKDVDISFVGHINCPERAELLTAIRAAHPNTFVGHLFFNDMARQYSRSRSVFNRSIRNDVNMRVFEAAGCGSLLLTNDLTNNGLAELFTDGKHLVTYRSADELLEKLAFYLKHDKAREQIATAGYAEVLARHTYLHRMSQLLRSIESAGIKRNRNGTVATNKPSDLPPSTEPPKPLEQGLTSIVVVTYNQLEYTKLCLESVLQRTDARYELIVVDNGSTDGTLEYLRSIPVARVIQNPQNLGFPRAANQGIRAARGQQIVLLNNDVVVSSGWLGRMLAPLAANPAVALVGPCTNWISGAQQVSADYADYSGVDPFAAKWAQMHCGECEPTERLVGFCLLFRRSLVERIGQLDERFGIGNFEDDDYCRRAKKAGYRGVIARDCFVHHFGSRTFLGSGIDRVRVLQENERLFRRKWSAIDIGTAPETDLTDGQDPSAVHSSASLKQCRGLEPEMALSLCMIVRDSSRTLPACLQSIAPWVDEMIVVDTGSTDNSVEISHQLGASVHHFPWCDDFAAARNESLRHARGRWLFWMDSDDTIEPDCGRRLRQLALQDHDSNVLGYVVQVRCPGPSDSDGVSDVTAVDHVKLLRNRQDVRFEGRIHEQVLPAIRRAGGEVGWTDLFVTHSGSDQTPQGRSRKRERDLKLLKLELAERPGHTFTLFNLGMTYADGNDHIAAISALRSSLAAAISGDSHLRKVYALLVASYCAIGRDREALKFCDEGLAACPRDTELLFRRGTLLHRLGQLDDAESIYLSLLGGSRDRYFGSVDVGILGHKVRHNLAVLHAEAGRYEQAELQWRAVLRQKPSSHTALRGLWQALNAQGKSEELAREADRTIAADHSSAEGWCMKAESALLGGRCDLAREHFLRAAREHPQDPETLSALCGFLFDHGPLEEAERSLTRLVQLAPQNAAAHHNLGTVCLRSGQYQAAIQHFRRSLLLRPGSQATRDLLAHAQRQTQSQHQTGTSLPVSDMRTIAQCAVPVDSC